MTARDQLTQVTDGDQLNDGYFNEIGVFYKEITDDGVTGTYSEALDTTTQLVTTITFSSVPTNYHVVGVEFDDIAVTGTEGGGNPISQSRFGFIISDGTNHYSAATQIDQASNSTAGPWYWDAVSVGSPDWIVYKSGSGVPSTNTYDYMTFPVPIGMITGATSYTLYLYLYNAEVSNNTTSIATGFTARLVFSKRPQSDGDVSVAQA